MIKIALTATLTRPTKVKLISYNASTSTVRLSIADLIEDNFVISEGSMEEIESLKGKSLSLDTEGVLTIQEVKDMGNTSSRFIRYITGGNDLFTFR